MTFRFGGSMYRRITALICAAAVFGLAGCLGVPEGATVVRGFDVQRYLGKWYEIARLDHSFERGLSRVTAEYSLRDDGDIRVINRGYDASKGKWDQAEGKAKFVSGPDTGALKVSFFGPFYGAYNIIELDQENYRYALVVGPDTSYLWILARSPELEPAVLESLLEAAREIGVDTSELIYPEHE